MYSMNYDIKIGSYKLTMINDVNIKSSVENLADTAVISLPASIYNKALQIEDKVHEGDEVVIQLGYGEALKKEFSGFVESISTDNGSLKINCEDALYLYRKDIQDKVLSNVSVAELLEHVNSFMSSGLSLSCNYEFKYDTFTIHDATGFDVLKKVQEETRANIYLKENTLHVHPQYSEIGREIIYDFAINVEKSDLKYMDARKRKLSCTVEGRDGKGKPVKITRGTPGGDKISLRLPGVSDVKTLMMRADEEIKIRSYSGYEGNLTGWLVPFVQSTDIVEIRDNDYEYKTGKYYVVAVETSFSSAGGKRKVTLGKKISK